jgi:hypothetical protein
LDGFIRKETNIATSLNTRKIIHCCSEWVILNWRKRNSFKKLSFVNFYLYSILSVTITGTKDNNIKLILIFKQWVGTLKFKLFPFINPFTWDFDLPKQTCLNGLFWFFFDKVRHFYQHFQLSTVTKKSFFLHFLMHRDVFLKKVVLQILLSNLNHHLF